MAYMATKMVLQSSDTSGQCIVLSHVLLAGDDGFTYIVTQHEYHAASTVKFY